MVPRTRSEIREAPTSLNELKPLTPIDFPISIFIHQVQNSIKDFITF